MLVFLICAFKNIIYKDWEYLFIVVVMLLASALDGPNFRFLRRIVREESIEPADNDIQENTQE